MVALCFAYPVLFVATVKRGHITYGIDDGTSQRGGGNYYWFSKDTKPNSLAGTFFWPILRGPLKCRPASSFANEAEYIRWFESENDVFMDDVTQIP